MKILSKPKLAPTIFRCHACGCEYEAEYGEYTVNTDAFATAYHSTHKICKCPICCTQNYMSDDFKEDNDDT